MKGGHSEPQRGTALLKPRNGLSAPSGTSLSRDPAARSATGPRQALRGCRPPSGRLRRGEARPAPSLAAAAGNGGKRATHPRASSTFATSRGRGGGEEEGYGTSARAGAGLRGRGGLRPAAPRRRSRGVGPGRGGCLVRSGPPRGLPGLTPHLWR